MACIQTAQLNEGEWEMREGNKNDERRTRQMFSRSTTRQSWVSGASDQVFLFVCVCVCVCFVCMCCRVRMERNLRQYHTIRPDSTLDWTVDSLLHGCLPCPMHACMVWYQCVSANVHKCGRRQFFYIILPFASGNICKLHHCLLVHMIQTSFSFSALLQVLHNSRSRSFYDQSQV